MKKIIIHTLRQWGENSNEKFSTSLFIKQHRHSVWENQLHSRISFFLNFNNYLKNQYHVLGLTYVYITFPSFNYRINLVLSIYNLLDTLLNLSNCGLSDMMLFMACDIFIRCIQYTCHKWYPFWKIWILMHVSVHTTLILFNIQ